MRYRPLGRTGLIVSELCLGTMTFAQEAAEDAARTIVARFLEAGGNFIDTADVYAGGRSEEIVGAAIRDRRREVVLATKFGFRMGPGPNAVRGSRKYVVAACEASLRRLGTDYIDLYQIHCWDALTPIEETLSALTDLIRGGKVRYAGASNFTGWHILKSACASRQRNLEPFVSLQPQYSLVERGIEYEVLPACREAGWVVIPFGPLGGGFLSGKYARDAASPAGTRLRQAEEHPEQFRVQYWRRRADDRNWAVLDVMARIAHETGYSPAQIALNWLLQQPGVTAPILGARSTQQLDDNLGATDWDLSAEQVGWLTAVTVPDDFYPYGFIRGAQRG